MVHGHGKVEFQFKKKLFLTQAPLLYISMGYHVVTIHEYMYANQDNLVFPLLVIPVG